jgi:hypothetical protein
MRRMGFGLLRKALRVPNHEHRRLLFSIDVGVITTDDMVLSVSRFISVREENRTFQRHPANTSNLCPYDAGCTLPSLFSRQTYSGSIEANSCRSNRAFSHREQQCLNRTTNSLFRANCSLFSAMTKLNNSSAHMNFELRSFDSWSN